jgi:hypothetical protein
VTAQREVLGPRLEALAEARSAADEVALWRRHSARAARAFLEELEARLEG